MPDILSFLHVVMENIVDAAILLFEFIGVGIIIFSGVRGFVLYLRRSPDTKLTLAKGLAMGLEFKLGSEILRGLIERTGSVSKALKWYSGAANHASDYGYGKKVLLERSRLVEAASGQPDKAVALLKNKRQGATYASSVKERKLSYETWTNMREERGLRVVTPSERRVEEPSV